jgi:hypothetical protein
MLPRVTKIAEFNTRCPLLVAERDADSRHCSLCALPATAGHCFPASARWRPCPVFAILSVPTRTSVPPAKTNFLANCATDGALAGLPPTPRQAGQRSAMLQDQQGPLCGPCFFRAGRRFNANAARDPIRWLGQGFASRDIRALPPDPAAPDARLIPARLSRRAPSAWRWRGHATSTPPDPPTPTRTPRRGAATKPSPPHTGGPAQASGRGRHRPR